MDEPLTMERGGNTYYYHRDGLGSITEVTTDTGALVERYEYDVYGAVTIYNSNDVTITVSAIDNPYLFTGRRYDPESGNYYYRARYYSPRLGRFLSMDPLGFGSGDYNLYRYAFNNPVNMTDPTGEIVWVPLVIGGFFLTLKIADYAWTAWDTWISYQVLKDECASDVDKLLAGVNIGMAIVFEGLEPDEWLPTGLPLDDAARKALLRGMREALEEGGPEALEAFLRRELGDDIAERVLREIDLDDLAEGISRITGPLSREAKDRLRAEARDIWERETGIRAASYGKEIHHRIPLEWAHLFPDADPNRLANLVAMSSPDHRLVSNAWTAFRTAHRHATPTAAEV